MSALASSASAQAQQWFVRQGATGTGFGVPAQGVNNWNLANASGDLGSVMLAASANHTIHVMEGVYRPNGTSPTATFAFADNNVRLRGAYLGTENVYASPPQGPLGNPENTILSGDLTMTNTPGVYHVVTVGAWSNIVIENFLIEYGSANGPTDLDRCGGGLLATDVSGGGGPVGSLRLSRLTFRNCSALLSGGGACIRGTYDLGIKYCNFRGNVAFGLNDANVLIGGGGGLALINLSGNQELPTNRVWSCDFSGNRGRIGGGILGQRGDAGTTFQVLNCKFVDNVAQAGGGILLDGESSERFNNDTEVSYCSFAYNTASAPAGATQNGGAAMHFGDNANIQKQELVRGTVTRFNTSTLAGLFIGDGDLREGRYTAPVTPMPTTTVSYSNIKRDTGPVGGPVVWPGVGNINADPLFANGALRDLRLTLGSPCIEAGDDNAIPPDVLDLDDNSDFTEWAPRDLTRTMQRELNGLVAPTGIDAARPNRIADMGCHEYLPQNAEPEQ